MRRPGTHANEVCLRREPGAVSAENFLYGRYFPILSSSQARLAVLGVPPMSATWLSSPRRQQELPSRSACTTSHVRVVSSPVRRNPPREDVVTHRTDAKLDRWRERRDARPSLAISRGSKNPAEGVNITVDRRRYRAERETDPAAIRRREQQTAAIERRSFHRRAPLLSCRRLCSRDPRAPVASLPSPC